jgi:hypothetical protein
MKTSVAVRVVALASAGAVSAFARADVVTLYDDEASFFGDLAALGGISQTLDFESLPDGTPVGPGDLDAPLPLTYEVLGGAVSADFTSGGQLVFEDFASVSPTHSLRDDTSPIDVALSSPVAAIGVWALDIDSSLPGAASALYQTSTLGSILQSFDNPGGGIDVSAFLGAIATNDAGTELVPIFESVLYDQAGASDFTYIDDMTFAIPSPGALGVLVLAGLAGRRRRA